MLLERDQIRQSPPKRLRDSASWLPLAKGAGPGEQFMHTCAVDGWEIAFWPSLEVFARFENKGGPRARVQATNAFLLNPVLVRWLA